MGVIAGFLVQNVLKYLLEFGEVSYYLGYNAMSDFFPKMKLKPNPNCEDSFCQSNQVKAAAQGTPDKVETVTRDKQAAALVHENNEWGISVVDESGPEVTENLAVAEGVRFAYDHGARNVPCQQANKFEKEVSLDDLVKQMKSL